MGNNRFANGYKKDEKIRQWVETEDAAIFASSFLITKQNVIPNAKVDLILKALERREERSYATTSSWSFCRK